MQVHQNWNSSRYILALTWGISFTWLRYVQSYFVTWSPVSDGSQANIAARANLVPLDGQVKLLSNVHNIFSNNTQCSAELHGTFPITVLQRRLEYELYYKKQLKQQRGICKQASTKTATYFFYSWFSHLWLLWQLQRQDAEEHGWI